MKIAHITDIHLDHIDGLKYFPATEIIVNRAEWERPFGDLPKLYPDWLRPSLVDLNAAYDVFERAHPLTAAGDLMLIETPGHTYHHCSVLLKTDQGVVFFAADICYTESQLWQEQYSGSNASHKLARRTYAQVKQFAAKNPMIFIPSHDAGASSRLSSLKFS